MSNQNLRIEVLNGKQVLASGLVERIIAFDKLNMRSVFEQAGIPFPEENRRTGLHSDPTFIFAFEGDAIAGYIEYLRSWNDPDYLYVGSIQIAKQHRNTRLILRLLHEFRETVSGEDFVGFETNVQKTNAFAVKMYRKIGFTLEENPNNQASWLARADRDLLETSPIVPLINKWREK